MCTAAGGFGAGFYHEAVRFPVQLEEVEAVAREREAGALDAYGPRDEILRGLRRANLASATLGKAARPSRYGG